MPSYLKVSDFTGEYNIPNATSNYKSADVQECIDSFELQYINQLLGVTLGKAVYDYLVAGTSGTAVYDKIIGKLSYQPDNGLIWESAGIKTFLKACIFYEFKKVGLTNTQAGPAKSDTEGSTTADVRDTFRYAENKFNALLATAAAIQQYCIDNSDTYTTYAGLPFQVKYSTVL